MARAWPLSLTTAKLTRKKLLCESCDVLLIYEAVYGQVSAFWAAATTAAANLI